MVGMHRYEVGHDELRDLLGTVRKSIFTPGRIETPTSVQEGPFDIIT